MNENFELLAERYRKYMQVLNYSDRTIFEYVRILNTFYEYLKARKIENVQNITKSDLMDFQREIYYRISGNGNALQPQTQNNYLKTVKSYFYFLYTEGYIPTNPARDIKYAKTPTLLPRTIITKEEFDKIAKKTNIHSPIGYRDRTIMEVLYSTAIRRMELLNLLPSDADLETGFLRVNFGKGAKDRVVPIGKFAGRYLKNYLKFIRPELLRGKDTPYLFVSNTGDKMSRSALAFMLHKYAASAKLEKRISPHVFRHSCATHLIQHKANIRCVQEILGHRSLDTTQQYIQLTITDLKAVHAECHPREQEELV